MIGTVMGWLNWAILGVLPWWSWVGFGAAAYAAVMYFVPIPKLNNAAALVAAVLLSGVGIKAWGFQEGYPAGQAAERTKWEGQVEAEKARLAAGFQKLRSDDLQRLAAATQTNLQLKKDRNDALRGYLDANGNPLVEGSPVCLPPDASQRLYDYGRGRQDGPP